MSTDEQIQSRIGSMASVFAVVVAEALLLSVSRCSFESCLSASHPSVVWLAVLCKMPNSYQVGLDRNGQAVVGLPTCHLPGPESGEQVPLDKWASTNGL